MTESTRIGLLGFGEVGQILGQELFSSSTPVSTFDVKFSEPNNELLQTAHASDEVHPVDSAAALAAKSEIVFSAVTAEQTESAAESTLARLQDGAWFVDLNSASPSAKQRAANQINARGARYVEVAVMSPVPPKRLATPLLLGGPHAHAFLRVANDLGFEDVCVFSDQYGQASAAKMCRSVMVKGIEALLLESLVTARTFGVESTVLDSLDDLFPGPNWPRLSKYMIERTLIHGGRRAEEMREVAKTVADAELAPSMSAATATVQDWAKEHTALSNEPKLSDLLDALAGAARDKTQGKAV